MERRQPAGGTTVSGGDDAVVNGTHMDRKNGSLHLSLAV